MDEAIPWINMIGNVGFPIVLVFYLLVRLERSFQRLESIIEILISEIRKR